jgi:hypothetical protein
MKNKSAKSKVQSAKRNAAKAKWWKIGILAFSATLLLALCPLRALAQNAPIKIVSNVPTNCTPLGTNSPVLAWKRSGTNVGLYECTATNTWTLITAITTTGTITANTFAYWGAGGALASEASLSYHGSTYSSASSFQPIGIDFTLAAGAGKNVADGTAYLSPIMGNVLNSAALTKTGNYLGGVIGAYSITGVRATTYPAGAVLGQITDGVTEADGSFVAFIDGDSTTTTATAGLKFLYNNSTVASGFDWAIDAYGAAHDGFQAVNFKKGFARIAVNAAPGSPPANSIATWADSTDKNLKSKDESGNISQTVRALTGVDGQVVTSMPSTGVLTTSTAEVRLSTTAAVDMNTATATTLYTSPTGRSTVITRVNVRNCSTSMTTASYSFGWEAVTFANVIANTTHTELTGATLYTVLGAKVGATVGTSTGTFKVLMNTLQGGAATCTMDVFGYTF